jgi:hypothetical protein
MLTLDKAPRLTLKKASYNSKPITSMQVFCALRKQTIKAKPDCNVSLWQSLKSGYCYVHANGKTSRVSLEFYDWLQIVADRRDGFWSDHKAQGNWIKTKKAYIKQYQ